VVYRVLRLALLPIFESEEGARSEASAERDDRNQCPGKAKHGPIADAQREPVKDRAKRGGESVPVDAHETMQFKIGCHGDDQSHDEHEEFGDLFQKVAHGEPEKRASANLGTEGGHRAPHCDYWRVQ